VTAPLNVLFVCTANICRSPYLELLARSRVDTVRFSSAGTHGYDGAQMDRTMAATLTDGIPHREFRSRALTRALIDEADLVLTAERSHRTFVLEEAPAAFRRIFTIGQFAEAVRRTPDVAGRELIAAASATPGIAQFRKGDISDPYRKGDAAAALAAEQMAGLLDVILPAVSATNSI
jgi:protein-tyrosine-phosphatase